MRKKLSKGLIMLFVFVLSIPAFWNSSTTIAQAASPKFAKSQIELVGVGEIYQLAINNKIAKSTYKWASSDKTVVKVSSKGVITAVGGGTATVRCKITYPSKSSKMLACKVIVTIPADDIRISNAQDKNGAHTMTVGDTFQFESEITPTNSTDKVFWTVGTGDKECIRIDNAAEGKVTAVKAGKVTLKATAAKDAIEAVANGNINIKNDAIIIEVVAPKAEVQSAEITGTTEITVVFDSPVDKSTIIDSTNKLTTNIRLTLGKDTKNVLAADPGTLTPSLSSDGKTLTITSANRFTGTYIIEFTNGIKTSTGIAMEEWYKTVSYIDTLPPSIVSAELDDSGMINKIHFSEAVDIAGLKVSATEVFNASITGQASTTAIATVSNPLNYTLSTDKKTLMINMSKLPSSDYGRQFTVTFTGIKDLSGLAPAGYALSTVIRTDTTKKPQAVPLYVTRTSYNTLTVTFSRPIKEGVGGLLSITGGGTYTGFVDSNDNTKVNYYNINDSDALITGAKTVNVAYYSSYNVIEGDTTANSWRPLTLDFTVDKTAPVLLTPEYDAASQILTLTFNEEVNLTSSTGIFSSIMDTITGERKSGTNINYTQVAGTDKKVIKLKMSNITTLGNYTFTIDPFFATDNFKNQMVSRVVNINNTTGSSSNELSGPYYVAQSGTNLNEIILKFINMVDVPSAQIVSNYTIPGVNIISAYVADNTKDNGATVVLTVADGSITATADRPITIKGVTGFNGAYSPITNFYKLFELKENVKPMFIGEATFDRTLKNNVKLSFSEQIKGTITFRVTQSTNSVPFDISNSVSVSGNTITINLSYTPQNGSTLRIDVLTNNITDSVGNALTSIPTTIGVSVNY